MNTALRNKIVFFMLSVVITLLIVGLVWWYDLHIRRFTVAYVNARTEKL